MVDAAVPPPDATRSSAAPGALARILTGCPCVTRATAIAVVGADAPACQLGLAAGGFTKVTAAPARGAALLRERYGCLCVTDGARLRRLDAATLAAWQRRLMPGGTLALDLSLIAGRDALAEALTAAGFRMVQFRALHGCVFLIGRAPSAAAAGAAVPTRRAA